MPYIITRDGKPTYGRYETDLDVLGEMHKRVGYSADHAFTHEGYAMLEVPADRWSDLEAKPMVEMACRQFSHHDCNHQPSVDARVNCQACCLLGYQPRDPKLRGDGNTRTDGPNVSGWGRLYVQAGRPIPAHWATAFENELTGDGDNKPYAAALKLDLATFGIRGKGAHAAYAKVYPS